MHLEIERKFLVDHLKWDALVKPKGKIIRQGYITDDNTKTIRLRVMDQSAFLTIKGRTTGATRSEYEYEIPLNDANKILDTLSQNEVSKTRYEIFYEHKLWEVDVFDGLNEGLIVAEIELASEDEKFLIPDWVTTEVTEDPGYYNSNLAKQPFKTWERTHIK